MISEDVRQSSAKKIIDRLNNCKLNHTQADFNKNNNFVDGFYLKDLSICDQLINFFNESDLKKQGTFGKDKFTKLPRVDTSVKNSVDLTISKFTEVECVQNYLKELSNIIKDYVEKYMMIDVQAPWNLFEKFNIQKYPPNGGYFNWHFERDGYDIAHRMLVFMTYLNDIEDEGETEWVYQNLKVKPKKGLTVIWPSDWTHTHRGVPSKTETKFIITGWYCYKNS
jgi:hypothetical protein